MVDGRDWPDNTSTFLVTFGIADVDQVDAGHGDVQLKHAAEMQTSSRQKIDAQPHSWTHDRQRVALIN